MAASSSQQEDSWDLLDLIYVFTENALKKAPDISILPVTMRTRQPLLSELFKSRHEHGGTLGAGHRKLARPIDPKRAMHVVLKSERAKGELSLLRRSRQVRAIIDETARRFDVRIHEFANVGNHLHILIRGKTRKGIQDFFRVVAGRLALLMTGARKGGDGEPFWSAPIYTRVVEWGRAFQNVRSYVQQNELEARGLMPHRPRARQLVRADAHARLRVHA